MPRIPVLTLTPDTLSEEQEQIDLLDVCDRNVHLYPDLEYLYHVPNGGWRGMRSGRRMKAAGVKPGVPDLCLPVARHQYHGLYIEMKKSNAAPSDVSPDQARWHAFLRHNGYCVAVCRGCSVAWTILLWYLTLSPAPNFSNLPPDPPVPLTLQPRKRAANTFMVAIANALLAIRRRFVASENAS